MGFRPAPGELNPRNRGGVADLPELAIVATVHLHRSKQSELIRPDKWNFGFARAREFVCNCQDNKKPTTRQGVNTLSFALPSDV